MTLNYGLIGNGQSAALVSDSAEIVWCCLPKFDSPSVFAKLLDKDIGGSFSVDFASLTKKADYQQFYKKNTNILETIISNESGSFRVIDFMPRWSLEGDDGYHHPPQLMRIIEPIMGPVDITVNFAPAVNYGEGDTRYIQQSPFMLEAVNSDQFIFFQSTISAEDWTKPVNINLTEPVAFIVSFGKPLTCDDLMLSAQQSLKRTTKYWRRWVRNCYLPEDYQVEIIRSALTLKMLIYEETGAVIAAPTMALPEIIGGERTWDYRYCWLRDSFFVIYALLDISHFGETENYLKYLCKLLCGDDELELIRPLYTIDGEHVPPERFLNHWQGHGGSRPVRVGNDATDHHQHDVYGELMLSLFPVFFDERFVEENLIDTPNFYFWVQQLAKLAMKYAPKKDNGIWEFRDLVDHYTFSKLLCWVALDRAAKIAFREGQDDDHDQWKRAAQELQNEIMERAWNDKVGAFTQAYGSEHLDASTLLMPRLGFIHPQDPRMLATIAKSEEALMKDGLVFRYTNHDDFGAPENAFTICTFWLIDALAMAGEQVRAQQMFNHVLQYGNHLGLFSEDINIETGALTGNFPQGYTHVAIINSAMLLAK